MTPAVKIFLISALLSSIEAKHFLVETEELIRPDVSKKGNNSTDSRKKIDNDYTIDKIARPDLSKNGKKSTDSGKKGGNLCLCKAVADNVCGTDGETYANPCVARCNKVGVQCRGECPCQGAKSVMASGTCLCPRIYSPVCGTDGNEYANSCWQNVKELKESARESVPV